MFFLGPCVASYIYMSVYVGSAYVGSAYIFIYFFNLFIILHNYTDFIVIYFYHVNWLGTDFR